jgi:acyl-homoserine lactone acylase PvdQ
MALPARVSSRDSSAGLTKLAAASLLALAASAFAQRAPADPDAGKVVVYRDEYGVPHLYAPTADGGVYAMGYAQAEDRLEELLKNYLRATGELAAAFGPSEFQNDVQSRLWRHYEIARRNFERIRPDVRRHLASYVQGINDYLAAHPAEVPDWWGRRKVDAYMPVAHGRQFMWGWPAGQALSELRRAGIEPSFTADARSSNQMAIAPARTLLKAPILIIDPHLSFWGAQRFWEFRVHAGELHGSGFTLPGSPYVGLGHNDHVAWAMTTGGPDTADIYALKLSSVSGLEYEYDGGTRSLAARSAQIRVKGEERPREVTFHDSHNGPVVGRQGATAYVAKLAYADEVQFGEAFYLFNLATDVQDFKKALALNQLMPQNVMAADTSGNIYYQRAGRVPIRPDGVDFSRPVDGSTAKTEWLGIHPSRDLISVENPPQGYMQNCNVSPDVMMVGSRMTPDKFKPYLFNQAAGRTHQRGARAVELMAAENAYTVEKAMALALDTGVYQYERWTRALRQADAELGAPFRGDADYRAGLEGILSWSGRSDRDSKGALKYFYWKRGLVELLGNQGAAALSAKLTDYMAALGAARSDAEHLTDTERRSLLEALADAMRAMKTAHGTLDLAFGDVFRVGRDDQSWPVGGGSLQVEGMATLRAIGFGPPRPDHTRWGTNGQTSTQLVVLTRPIQSWTQPPIGQSDRKETPHYRDQAEKLFGPARFKPTWYRKAELLSHVKSRQELKYVTVHATN